MFALRRYISEKFWPFEGISDPDARLETALYFMLWSIEDPTMAVDGWSFFRVIREAEESLHAVGLMTLLPADSIPIAMDVTLHGKDLRWTAQVGAQDAAWRGMSESKRWNVVYLYATGKMQEPRWKWEREFSGLKSPKAS